MSTSLKWLKKKFSILNEFLKEKKNDDEKLTIWVEDGLLPKVS